LFVMRDPVVAVTVTQKHHRSQRGTVKPSCRSRGGIGGRHSPSPFVRLRHGDALEAVNLRLI
jgi:hypothetical protein